MNILSLFDGCAMAKVALERAGIPISRYYASEIDKYAIHIARKNHPDIIQLGDIRNVSNKISLESIDLLIGGSPCQGFSFAGKQLNFEDERSKLFFEYVRILKECKPKYFLLENVKMKKEYQDIITEQLGGIQPIEINSALVSAQNRKRLYWTNILSINQPKDKNIYLKDILQTDYDYIKTDKKGIIKMYQNKASCLTGGGHSGGNHSDMDIICKQVGMADIKAFTDKLYRRYTTIECERLQTLPDNYTDGISNTQRYKMLGNGFTVDVISHILKGMI